MDVVKLASYRLRASNKAISALDEESFTEAKSITGPLSNVFPRDNSLAISFVVRPLLLLVVVVSCGAMEWRCVLLRKDDLLFIDLERMEKVVA